MLSQNEYQYIRDLVLQMYNQGYHNYFCITNNPIGSNNYNIYDVTCYFSQDSIEVQGNVFTLKNGIKIDFDSNTYSNNNTIDKIIRENVSSKTITTNPKEYVYSNIGAYPNLIAAYETSLNNHLSLNFAYLIPSILILQILILFIRSIFRKRG